MSKQTGTVKWFNASKGYGFLKPSDGGADVFVHMNDIKKSGLSSLSEGAGITYSLELDERSGKNVARDLEVKS